MQRPADIRGCEITPMDHKKNQERRRAPRLDCEIPVMLHGHGRSLPAMSSDLSRVGTLLRLPLSQLGVSPNAPLEVISRVALAFLGDRVKVDLHHEALGGLIQRTARPIRIGRADATADHVEVGLDLMRPLTEMEVEFLGIPLPRLYHEVDLTWEPPATSVSTGADARDVTVVLCSIDGDNAPPLRARPGHIDATGACADLGGIEKLPVLVQGRGAADVLRTLADAYGDEPEAVIMLDSQPVWSGLSRLQTVELCSKEGRVKLRLGFPGGLSAAARHRLGLNG